MTADSELETLLVMLRKHNVESYEYKDTKVVFRFPAKAPQLVYVQAPQDAVDEFDAAQAAESDEEEVVVIDRTTNKAVALPANYRKMFRAVPRDV